jgi:thioesterase domain-containing protein
LKISDIFVYKTPELLFPRIIHTKDVYQTAIKLNNANDKPNMFMIHPGTGGCESYISLASALANNFSCYGIDSYNLYNENKIDNLNELAQHYLSSIEDIMRKTHQEEYHILGWSLGGQISLEIASILETRGNTKIKIYLLDTFLSDSHIFSLRGDMHAFLEKAKNNYIHDANSRKYDELYIQKALSTIDVEDKLEKQKISSILKHTNILLFKAMLEDTRSSDNFNKKLHEYTSTVPYNNVDKIFKEKYNIKIIKATHAHHGNILDQEELLVSEIIFWNDYFTSEINYEIAI